MDLLAIVIALFLLVIGLIQGSILIYHKQDKLGLSLIGLYLAISWLAYVLIITWQRGIA